MKGKQILIAFIALVLLASYFYFFSIKKKQDEQKAKDAASVIFPDVKAEDITEAALKLKDAVVTLKKTGSEWDMTGPLKVPADQNMMKSVLNHIAGAKAGRKIEGALLADFGLTTPAAYISYVDRKNKKGTVYMAGLNPTGESAYGYKEGDNSTVFLLDKDMRGTCDKTVKDFRYKGLLRYAEDDMTKLEVNLKDKKYTMEKSGGEWYVTAPIRKLAKSDRATVVSSYAVNSNIKEYLDASAAGKYGLLNPSEYVKIYENGKEHTIYFGMRVTQNASVYAKSDFQPGIVEIPDYIYNGPSRLDEVINKQVIIFKQENVIGVSVNYGDKAIKAVRNAPGKRPDWIIKEAKGIEKKDMGSFNTGTLVSSIAYAEFRQVIINPDSLKEASEYGLSPAAAEIIMVDKDGKLIGKLLVGAKKGTDEVYVKNTEKNTVYVIPESSIKNMAIPGLELK